MKKIEINCGKTKAVILPSFGGVVSSFVVDGIEVLRMNQQSLGIANCLAGGIPILFPFSSKVTDDTYKVNNKEYTMPMHGFVKDMSFSVEKQTDNSVTVYTVPNEVILKENYPFEFRLHVQYTVSEKSLYVCAKIDNLSKSRMPYYIGWHTYFRTSNKKETQFDFDFKDFTSYLDGEKGKVKEKSLDLSAALDHVFTGIGNNEMTLSNFADGYEAVTIVDEMHEVLTVCTAFDDCVCIEPWTAVPDAINTGQMLRYVEPGSYNTCGFEIKVKPI